MIEKQLTVVVGIIRKGNKTLMTRRHPKSKFAASMWQFPGGKIEMFEDPVAALEREIREETSLKIRVGELYHVGSVILETPDEKRHVILIGYLCDWVSGEVKTENEEEWKWMSRKEMNDFELTPGTTGMLAKYLK